MANTSSQPTATARAPTFAQVLAKYRALNDAISDQPWVQHAAAGWHSEPPITAFGQQCNQKRDKILAESACI